MNLANFGKLKKLLERTFSESDNEALSAIRAANRILKAEDLTWERVLSRTVNVIAEVEGEVIDDDDEPLSRSVDQGVDADLIEQARRAAQRGGRGEAFVGSVAQYFHARGSITPAQRAALRKFANGQ